jgi:16S rRNA (cytosine967-C5)-methyltransferase
MPLANPRSVCVHALKRWEEGALFADDILHEALAGNQFALLDRAFLTEIFYGVLRNLSLLDFLIKQLREEPLDVFTRQVMRLGLYQIFHMRIPHHAAVNETVNLAKQARGLVNALLRRSIRENETLHRRLNDAPPEVRLSHPNHLIRRWQSQFGAESANLLCEWNNTPAEVYVRANGLKVSPGELLRGAADSEPHPAHPAVIRVKYIPFRWIISGLCYVQDPSTLIACELLAPQPGERVLDACAAPGGKTSYLAQLMEDRGEIVACDASRKRLERLNENLRRLGATLVRPLAIDWIRDPIPLEPGSFDRILVDAPCSNTGVIRRRVDVRWRLAPGEFHAMQEKQVAILRKIAPFLREGGTLVYSTCSLEPEENEGVVARACEEIQGLRFIESRKSLPFRDAIDGAFAAKFERQAVR